ncbi:MAG: hypothetical protein KGJ13_01600 [Patescibacteria group bacterium]|nr:hypothetical protein [Patescibacteria group bacterium]
MTPRTAQILEAAIESYINSGEPVSSGRLYDDYDFGIKPAMIRLELDALEEAGYLGQPYHSAGRVPTDAGYEFFVKQILEDGEGNGGDPILHPSFSILQEKIRDSFLENLSSELGLLGIAADLARDTIIKTGLEELISNLDWQNHDEICSVIRDFEEVDGRLPQAAKKLDGFPKVFIGRKSPVTKSENLAVVGERRAVDGHDIFVFAIGPKRMDYRKAIRIFRNL